MSVFDRLSPRAWVAVVLLAALFMLPVVVLGGNWEAYLVSFGSRVMALAIAALSLDILLGYGGMLSLGHAGFLGIGAYAVAILSFVGITNGFFQFLVAIVASGVIALIFGLIALRTSGIYFLMITLALTQLLYYIGMGLGVLGGDDGFTITRSHFTSRLTFDNPLLLYYFSFCVLTLVLWFGSRLVKSRFGMSLRGIKSNERRMAALGYSTMRHKLVAFVLAGVFCGVAGALFVNLQAFMSPAYLSWIRSGELIVMVLIGGSGTLVGSILGSGVMQAMESFLPNLIEAVAPGNGQNWPLIFGPLLIVLVLGFKGGILSSVSSVSTASKDRRRMHIARAKTRCAEATKKNADIVEWVKPQTDGNAAFLEIKALHKCFGSLCATDHVSLNVRARELHAIIGPNGAGKTTLLAQIAGEILPDSGTILLRGVDVTNTLVHQRVRAGIVRSYQITSIFGSFTVLQNISMSIQAKQRRTMGMWANASDDPQLLEPAMQILERVGLGSRALIIAEELSHGEQRRLELGMAIALEPDLLLLDEPLAGVGGGESDELVQLIMSLKEQFTIILVEHDINAIFTLADQITVLEYGRVIATGKPEEIRNSAVVRSAYLGKQQVA